MRSFLALRCRLYLSSLSSHFEDKSPIVDSAARQHLVRSCIMKVYIRETLAVLACSLIYFLKTESDEQQVQRSEPKMCILGSLPFDRMKRSTDAAGNRSNSCSGRVGFAMLRRSETLIAATGAQSVLLTTNRDTSEQPTCGSQFLVSMLLDKSISTCGRINISLPAAEKQSSLNLSSSTLLASM